MIFDIPNWNIKFLDIALVGSLSPQLYLLGKTICPLWANESMAIDLKFITFGLAAKDRVVIQDQAGLAWFFYFL